MSASESAKPTIGCIIPTFRAKKHVVSCLSPLVNSPLKPKILVIDSSSNDGTAELARDMGAEVFVIPQSEFNHGLTREKARRMIQTEIVCLLTQDAYLVDEHALGALILPLLSNQAHIAYARQIPHKGAAFFEAFSRLYNYPEKSHIRGMEDIPVFGAYTFFCSNSCAAYSSAALDEIGGFEHVLLGEDTLATAKILKRGYKIAYVAEAVVHHSHHYSLGQEFSRSFDTGYARKKYDDFLQLKRLDIERGKAYAWEMLKQAIKKHPLLGLYTIFHLMARWGVYQIGRRAECSPLWLKKKLSSHQSFWLSDKQTTH